MLILLNIEPQPLCAFQLVIVIIQRFLMYPQLTRRLLQRIQPLPILISLLEVFPPRAH